MTEHMKQVDYDTTNANATIPEPRARPPPYEYATGGQAPENNKGQDPERVAPKPGPSPPYVPAPGPSGSPLYYYQHPVTGHMISTPLSPDHPEMICLQEGTHIHHTRFGILGVLAAVFWFPLGIGLCLLDRRIVCKRCGRVIDDGISC